MRFFFFQPQQIQTDLRILNWAGPLSEFKSKVRDLVDIWSFVGVWLQHVSCGGWGENKKSEIQELEERTKTLTLTI